MTPSPTMDARSKSAAAWALVALAIAYAGFFRDRGWIPHDEGLLGQSAERVLHGELPHIHFDDPYTGGLSFLHAAVFALLGTELANLRLVLFLAFAATAVLLMLIAQRLAQPLVAAAVVVCCVVWSLPNYPAPLPSWYQLCLSVAGTYALLRAAESRRNLWPVLAGLAGGVACLFKITGVYFLIPAGLSLLFMESSDTRGSRRGITAAVAFVVTAFLVLLVRRTADVATIVQFVLPGAVMALVLVMHAPSASVVTQLRRLAPFLLGAMVPIALFVAFYAVHDGVQDLIRGVFILPQKRLASASYPLPPLWTVVAAVPVVLALWRWPDVKPAVLVGVGAVLVLLAATGGVLEVYQWTWRALRPLIPAASMMALVVLRSPSLAALQKTRVYVLASVAAFASLVQYPYAFGVYFCYVAPLVVLAWTALVTTEERAPRTRMLHGMVLAFLTVFAIAWVNPGFVRSVGVSPQRVELSHLLLPGRAGLWVPGQHAAYEAIVETIQQHTRPGDVIYAAPDCPEVYFLAGRRNATRTLYDFMDDPEGRVARIVRMLDEHDVQLAVIRHQPEFSGAMDPVLVEELGKRFPNSASFGPFQVLWKNPAR